jgi:hypothetical protein
MKDPPAGLTIFRIEEIDLDGGRGLSKAIRWERKENEKNNKINGKEKLPHKSPLRLRHLPKVLSRAFAIADSLKY